MKKQLNGYPCPPGMGSRQTEIKSAGDGHMSTEETSRETPERVLADLKNLDRVIRQIMKCSH